MNAAEIRDALRRFCSGNDRTVVFEVPDGVSGNATRYADAVIVNFWASRGMELEGCEIKCSRSDWKRELDMPKKADAHFSRSDKWWLVTPVPAVCAVATANEIPPTWGWLGIERSGNVRILKKAPKLVPPVKPDRGYLFGIIRAAARWDAKAISAEIAKRMEAQDQRFTERVNAAAAGLARSAPGVEPPLMGKLREAFGQHLDWVGDDRIIAALKALHAVAHHRTHATHRVNFSETAKGLREMADNIERAEQTVTDIVDLVLDRKPQPLGQIAPKSAAKGKKKNG